jgi:hypothetical protein
MFLSEIIDIVLFETGQFFFSTTTAAGTNPMSCLGISKELFYTGILKRELGLYERYRPDVYTFNVYASPTGNAESTVVFSETTTPGLQESYMSPFDPRLGSKSRDPGRIPEWIQQVVPVNVLTTAGILYLIHESRFINTGERTIIHEPRTFLWQYEKPILFVTETGGMDITAAYKYQRIESYDSQGNLEDIEFVSMEPGKDSIFIDLVIGKFLQAVGRSRRAFQLNDSPIQYDATELVAEGVERYAQATEQLYEQSEWWSAIGT